MSSPRDYHPDDASAINALALKSFHQYRHQFNDWQKLADGLACFSNLASEAEIIVAESEGFIFGAVAYVGPKQSKADYFPADTPIIRMLVVDPDHRGRGLGRVLTEACLLRAKRDDCRFIALHTSPIMSVALPMYLRMGFEEYGAAPNLFGVPYRVYRKKLD